MAFTPTYYPQPTGNDTQDLLTIFQFVSSATDGLFFPIMILAIWIIQFISVMAEGRRASNAWIFASFTASILSIMLGILALIEQKWVYLIIIALSFGVFWIKLVNTRE